MSRNVLFALLTAAVLLANAGVGEAQEKEAQDKKEAAQGQTEEKQTEKDPKLISVPGGKPLGMSILGNQEAPTSLVIVPWKSSEIGKSLSISPMLDDSRQPIDKEVFMRVLSYYQISKTTHRREQ